MEEPVNVVVRGQVRKIAKASTGGYKLNIDVFESEKEGCDKIFSEFQEKNCFVTLVLENS